MSTAIGTATLFHADCPVCVPAGQSFHIVFGASLAHQK